MELHIQIKNPEKLSPSLQDTVTQQVKFHAQKSMDLLSIPKLTITIFPNHTLCIPETGEGGYTPSEHEMDIYIDPTKSKTDLIHIIENIIPSTIYHEAHHAARWINPGYGETLLEGIITEGLACIFAEEQFPLFIPAWMTYSKEEIIRLTEIALTYNFSHDSYDHTEWFFGEGEKFWLGYKVGTYIVREAKKQSGLTALTMAHMTAKEIFALSGIV